MTARPAIRSQSSPRIEYLGFRNVDEAREYRYAVHSTSGSCEFRFVIGLGAFAKAHLLIQDGPDVCYRQLALELAAGDNLQEGSRSLRADELNAYRIAQTPSSRAALAWAAAAPPPTTGSGRDGRR